MALLSCSRTYLKNPSSSARQEPADSLLELGRDFFDILRGALHPLQELAILPDEEGGGRGVDAVKVADLPVGIAAHRECQAVGLHEPLGWFCLVPGGVDAQENQALVPILLVHLLQN